MLARNEFKKQHVQTQKRHISQNACGSIANDVWPRDPQHHGDNVGPEVTLLGRRARNPHLRRKSPNARRNDHFNVRFRKCPFQNDVDASREREIFAKNCIKTRSDLLILNQTTRTSRVFWKVTRSNARRFALFHFSIFVVFSEAFKNRRFIQA